MMRSVAVSNRLNHVPLFSSHYSDLVLDVSSTERSDTIPS